MYPCCRGWGNLGEGFDLPDTVLPLDNVPHDWLMPHCCAVVHHGGAGTTAAGQSICRDSHNPRPACSFLFLSCLVLSCLFFSFLFLSFFLPDCVVAKVALLQQVSLQTVATCMLRVRRSLTRFCCSAVLNCPGRHCSDQGFPLPMPTGVDFSLLFFLLHCIMAKQVLLLQVSEKRSSFAC